MKKWFIYYCDENNKILLADVAGKLFIVPRKAKTDLVYECIGEL